MTAPSLVRPHPSGVSRRGALTWGAGLLLGLAGASLSSRFDVPAVEAAGAGADPGAASALVRAGAAPAFTLTAIDGSSVSLGSLRGSPVVLNFWATWCAGCREEMADLERAYRAYRDRGLTLLGVDVRESASKVASFVSAGGYSWPMLLDQDGSVRRAYGVTAIPTTVFVDRDGAIQTVNVGPLDRSALEAKLAALVG